MDPHHIALSCIFNGLDDPQSLFETHLFNHISTDWTKFLAQNEKRKSREITTGKMLHFNDSSYKITGWQISRCKEEDLESHILKPVLRLSRSNEAKAEDDLGAVFTYTCLNIWFSNLTTSSKCEPSASWDPFTKTTFGGGLDHFHHHILLVVWMHMRTGPHMKDCLLSLLT